ncbi:hypothetical protein VTK56DRAFT_9868 [Thermocarpiscus australiensis]
MPCRTVPFAATDCAYFGLQGITSAPQSGRWLDHQGARNIHKRASALSIAAMPLHLLGKKSWNVYNPANIARVRRDEAAARAREEAEERRMQEADAARRLAILRGEIPPPPEPEALPSPSSIRDYDRDAQSSSFAAKTGRKRKRHGEDDTDFEMRLARERASAASDRSARELAASKPSTTASTTTAPSSLVDSRGHITLFSEAEIAARQQPAEKNEEAEREAARKKREFEDQYQMRFVNAAGKDGRGLTDGGPWYASADGEASAALVPSGDVWGREDPGRKVREAARLDASDPLAMMKRGAAKVRELERERKREAEERERELRMLRKEERRREKRERRREDEEGGRRREHTRDSPDRRDDRSERGERSSRHRDGDDREERHRHRSRERDRPRHEERDGHERRGHRDDDKQHHRSHRSNKSRDRHSSRDHR